MIKTISVLFLLCSIISAETIAKQSPSVELSLKQVILPLYDKFYVKNFFGAYGLMYGVCVKDGLLGIPYNYPVPTIDIYLYDDPTSQYSRIVQITNSTEPKLNGQTIPNPIDCAFLPFGEINFYDMVLSSAVTNGQGEVIIFFRNKGTPVSYSPLDPNDFKPDDSTSFFGERMFLVDDEGDRFLVTARKAKSFYIVKRLPGDYTTFSRSAKISDDDFGGDQGLSATYQGEYLYYGFEGKGYKAYNIPRDTNNVTRYAARDIPSPNNDYGVGAAFIGQDLIALYKLGIDYIGGIDVLKYDNSSSTWSVLDSFSPTLPPGFDAFTQQYRYGQMLVANKTLIYVTTQLSTIHVLSWNGTKLVEVTTYTNKDSTINIGACDKTAGAICNPAPMVFAQGKLLVPGNVTTFFGVTIQCNVSGYRLSESENVCNDIDECAEGTHTCSPLRTCVNIPGGFKCESCPDGYLDDGLYNCTDVDECKDGTDGCSRNPIRECLNHDGNYSCGPCPAGYVETDEFNCEDIDECKEKTDLCSRDPLRECVNGDPPGYTCGPCPKGYSLNGPYNCTSGESTTGGETGNTGTNTGKTGSSSNTGNIDTGKTQPTSSNIDSSDSITLIMINMFVLAILLSLF